LNTSTHTYSRGGSASNFFSFSSKGKREETSAPQFYYEKDNHLGNVLTVVSDRKLGVDNNSDNIVDFYLADVRSATDYYAFGAPMPGRSFNSTDYTYGYMGMLKDDEVKGSGNLYSTEFREYDTRLGRWWSVDPVNHEMYSPYSAYDNNPIYYTDPEGADSENEKKNDLAVNHPGVGGSAYETNDEGEIIGSFNAYGKGDANAPSGATPNFVFSQDEIQPVKNYFIENAKTQTDDCIECFNKAIRSLLNKPGVKLGGKIDKTAAILQASGNAGVATEFEFNNASGKKTTGTSKPETMIGSMSAEAVRQANGQASFLVFGLSIADGFHTMTLTLDNTNPSSPTFSLSDQNPESWGYTGGWLEFDAVGLDNWITERTGKYHPVPTDSGKPGKTRATIWRINK